MNGGLKMNALRVCLGLTIFLIGSLLNFNRRTLAWNPSDTSGADSRGR